MRKLVDRYKIIKNHPYSRSVFFVTIGNMVINIANYLFHVIGGRYLGPSLYGSLASLVSLLYIVSVLATVFATVALRELTKLWSRGEKNKFYLLFKLLLVFFSTCGGILLFIFFFSSSLIARYLALQAGAYIILVGVIGFLTMVNSLFGAFQQATLRFKEFSYYNAATSVFKIFFVALTWYLNLLIFGMLGSIILSLLLYLLLSFFDYSLFLKTQFSKFKIEADFEFSLGEFLKESGYILMANIGMVGFLTMDTILVKHFFSPFESGLYAGVAVMGRVILFASTPLLLVMMPFIIQRREKKRNFRKIFFTTFFLVFLCSIGLLLLYVSLPKLVIFLFYGSQYYKAIALLPAFGIYMLFYTLANVFITYYIAMEEKRVLALPLIGAGLQIVLINLFHQTLSQVIKVSAFCAALLLVALLVKFISYDIKRERK